MKFSELHPKISETDITFDCLKCGPPHRVGISARHNGAIEPGVWTWSCSGSEQGYDGITISPSIQSITHGRKPCGWHVSIVNGEVIES